MKRHNATLDTNRGIALVLTDLVAVILILILPALSHLLPFPLYYLDPMRLVLFAAYFVWDRAFKSMSNRRLIVGAITALVLIAGGFAISAGWARVIATGDTRFLEALPITLYYSLGTVPAEIVIALILAYILFQKIRGQEFFRMLYFLPYITPVVATAVVFRTIFSPRETSLANQVVGVFGMGPFKWLFESKPFNEIFGRKA